MLDAAEIQYFRVRYEHAKAMAEAAISPAVQSLHQEMADRYAEIVEAGAGSKRRAGRRPGSSVRA